MLKIKKPLIIFVSLALALTFILPGAVLADPGVSCGNGYTHPTGDLTTCVPITSTTSSKLPTQSQVKDKLATNPIVKDLNIFVTALTGLVGIVVVGNIIAGGIQYSSAGGNPQKLSDARKRIANSLLAFFAFLLIWAFIQWLVPGGVFG